MENVEFIVNDNISFNNKTEVLEHLYKVFLAKNIVKESYKDAIIEREVSFPTGIQLENYAIAIPHCEASHALKPAIYIIKPQAKVFFQQADADEEVGVSLIVALVVTDPKEQLKLLRALFKNLQNEDFSQKLLDLPEKDIVNLMQSALLA